MNSTQERRQELTEHLGELRTRLVRSAIYILIGCAASWFLYDYIFKLLTYPMQGALKQLDTKFLYFSFTEPFALQMQISIVAGLILSAPLTTLEIWGFVKPGLALNERKPVRWMVPLASILFIGGVCFGYWILPAAFDWFAGFVPAGAELRPNVQQSVLFALKMLLVIGLIFEEPIIVLLLAKIGIIDAKWLIANWRAAVVGGAVLAAVATPSNDAITMLMVAVPVIALYFFSVLLVWLIERKNRRR